MSESSRARTQDVLPPSRRSWRGIVGWNSFWMNVL